MTIIFIVLLALLLLAVVAAPLFSDSLVDSLPDLRDPVTVDLEEERDALLRAIRELDGRADLNATRREELRVRYEAKAARVLRLLDERTTQQAAAPARPARRENRRVPWSGLALALTFVGIAAALGGWVLPRTGQASVTSFFQQDLDSARQLQALQQAAAADPSEENLLALGELYWQLSDVEGVLSTYRQAVDTLEPAPAVALKRLALLQMGSDPERARNLLEQSVAVDDTDAEALFYLGELQLVFGEFEAAHASWSRFAELPETLGDERSQIRLALLDELIPLYRELEENPTAVTLASIGDAWWRAGEQELAVDTYFRILTEFDPLHTEALSRTGQVLFTSGRVEEAVVFLDRAAADGAVDPDALLFLGNGRFSLGEFQAAIDAWTRYVEQVGEDAAGRVPGLIEQAEARLRGEVPAAGPAEGLPGGQADLEADFAPAGTASAAASLFAANCASCHGSQATGGTGPALAGNERVRNEAMVANTIRFGRGAMPGFLAQLEPEEITLLVDFVTQELAGR